MEDNFWEKLLSAGQTYFNQQQNLNADVKVSQINADALTTAVKWIAIAVGVFVAIRTIFK